LSLCHLSYSENVKVLEESMRMRMQSLILACQGGIECVPFCFVCLEFEYFLYPNELNVA
jgi:hypothetical protein